MESIKFENRKSPSSLPQVLYHGTRPENICPIMECGFDERLAKDGFFGRGINFSPKPEGAAEFAFGPRLKGCDIHHEKNCDECDRYIIISKVNMGIIKRNVDPTKPPKGNNNIRPERIIGHPPIGCNR